MNNTIKLNDAIKHAMEKAGIETLKEKQLECIEKFMGKNDVFGSLPTGYGKSYIYALLPEIFNFIRGKSRHIESSIHPADGIDNHRL